MDFEWIDIPSGEIRLNKGGYITEDSQSFQVAAFRIAKYPVTNAQFAQFIAADGYQNEQWWTHEGWHIKENRKWKTPGYWDAIELTQSDCPVIGVSWCEAVAFCLWFSDVVGKPIRLPTEQEWQRAAQGNTDWLYPWGKTFDSACCNFKSELPTPVTQYPNGASLYGVMDMCGNGCEWCSNNYHTGETTIDTPGIYRVQRGGSWMGYHANVLHRYKNYCYAKLPDFGFRLARPLARN